MKLQSTKLYLISPNRGALPLSMRPCTSAGMKLSGELLRGDQLAVPGAPGVICRMSAMHDLALAHYDIAGEIAAEAAVTWLPSEDTRSLWYYLCDNLATTTRQWAVPPPMGWYWAAIVRQPLQEILSPPARTALLNHFSMIAPAVLARTVQSN